CFSCRQPIFEVWRTPTPASASPRQGLFIWFISLSTRRAVWTPRPCQNMVPDSNSGEGLESHPAYAEIRCKERGRSRYPIDGVGPEPLLRLTRGDAGQRALRLFPPPASIHHFAIRLEACLSVPEIESELSSASRLHVGRPKISTFSVAIVMSG